MKNESDLNKIEVTLLEIGKNARGAARIMAKLDSNQKNELLIKMSKALLNRQSEILSANRIDVENGERSNLSAGLIDRLLLTESRIKQMALSIEEISKADDPVGLLGEMKKRPNNLLVGKMQVPLGVVGLIYESRPNVTSDATALCLKSGNAIILKGGKEAFHSNQIIAKILSDATKGSLAPETSVQLIPFTEREATLAMLKLDKYIDIIMPRGSYEFIEFVSKNSSIPMVKHDRGLCHLYIASSADVKMAESIVVNSKTDRPSVCNALETLLVNEEFARRHLKGIIDPLLAKGVRVKGCKRSLEIIPTLEPAVDSDFDQEWLDMILSLKIVKDTDEAIKHIATHGSLHTESIVTESHAEAFKFLKEVDSSVVLVNASTRFNDGSELGLGAEVGISTQKLHCRGPMGITDLTSKKWIVFGDGQIRG
ncbi:MAG: glutamate-5-semialdehyde dehydrogenase [Nitrospinota bacterium]